MMDLNITEKISSEGWDDSVSRRLISEIENTVREHTKEAEKLLRELEEIDTSDIERCLDKANQYFEQRG